MCKQGILTCLSLYLYFSVLFCVQCMLTCECKCTQLMSIAEAIGVCQHLALSISTLLLYFLKVTSLNEPRAMSSILFPPFMVLGLKENRQPCTTFYLGSGVWIQILTPPQQVPLLDTPCFQPNFILLYSLIVFCNLHIPCFLYSLVGVHLGWFHNS